MMSQRATGRNLAACLLLASAHAAAEETAIVDHERVNEIAGVELLADGNLWDDEAVDVAKRLRWPLESKTSADASYRTYHKSGDLIFQHRPRSSVLHALDGKPAGISIVFSNKGDSVAYVTAGSDRDLKRAHQEQARTYKRAIQKEKRELEETLTDLFGEHSHDRIGQGRQTREQVKRWDWNGHAFMLAAPRDEYVALRIMPVEEADNGGRNRTSDRELRGILASRVERRPNGDVILTDMPMVDQGPKGYCVPATWERVMRYMGVPADMYVLAMAGDSGAGGGTNVSDIAAGAREAIVRSGRKINQVALRPDVRGVAKFIDEGLPIMWAMYSTAEFNDALAARAKARRAMENPDEWKDELRDARREARKFRIDRDSGHVCMIIGYNKDTDEIAVSDSWGQHYAERWATPEEMRAISQGSFTVIDF
jgi:hypothetical protein